ncbi:transcriptional regulator [Aerococcaceae bacterium zg-B36]|uniref:helix-turn-helix domain-containing protein n=1 Tax=Aerococcaceae bacterium zg-252 TaxID=2796928 RepID=UPI001BD89770|nr:transcriptional regulator [Aerococcaceae bacterium zg-B36]
MENDVLKTLRKDMGLTLQDVADYLGISKQGYSSIEKGKIKDLAKYKSRLEKLYKTKLDSLLSVTSKYDLSKAIKYYRIKKGLTQEELGEIIGFTKYSIKRWESGESQPQKDNLEKIAQALEVDIYELTKERPTAEFNVKRVVEKLNKAKKMTKNQTIHHLIDESIAEMLLYS